MKTILTTIVLLLGFQVLAQDRYYTKSGKIDFFSRAPLEDIEAKNNQVAAYIIFPEGTISFAVLIKSFQFEKALMQEHFNENYMESEQYPKAMFTGSIKDADNIDLKTNGEYSMDVSGDLTIREITKQLNITAILKIEDGVIQATSNFYIKPSDFGISIPSTVKDNIANDILVKVDARLEKYTK